MVQSSDYFSLFQTEIDGNSTQNFSTDATTLSPTEPTTQVQYAYFIAGSLLLLNGFMFGLLFITGDRSFRNTYQETEVMVMTRSAPEKRKYYFTFVTSVCLMNLMASTLTLTYSTYLTAYVVDELQWSKSSGAVLISTFWFFCTAGRFLGVLVVRWLSTELMLLGTIVSTVVFILPELIFAHLHPSVMWICTSGFGLSVATIYANSLTFGNMYVAFYGRIGALVVAAGSLGNAIGPSFIAPLFQSSGMKVFLVVLFVSALVMFFMFGLSWLVGKKLGKKSSLMYETMRENEPLLHSQKSNGKCETNNDEGKTDFET